MIFGQIKNFATAHPIQAIIGTGILCVLLVIGWLYFTKGINGIQSFFFFRQANQKQAEVEARLQKAEEQQEIIDKTLLDLALAKAELKEASEARAEAEKAFNDQSKTASEKIQEFRKIMAADPVHTDPAGVTTKDLCERAKAAASNPDLIAALCAQ